MKAQMAAKKEQSKVAGCSRVCRGRSGDDSRIHNRPLFQQQSSCLKQLYYLSKQLLLQPIAYQKIPPPPLRVTVRHLIAGVHAAEIRKGAAVDGFCHRCFVGQGVQILH